MSKQSPPSQSFAELLKVERARLDLTQEQTADLLEVSKSVIEKWERGNRIPLKVTQEGALARLRAKRPKA